MYLNMDSRQFKMIVFEFRMTRVFDTVNIRRIELWAIFLSELCYPCSTVTSFEYQSKQFDHNGKFFASIGRIQIGLKVKSQVYQWMRNIPKQSKHWISQCVKMMKIESYDKRNWSHTQTFKTNRELWLEIGRFFYCMRLWLFVCCHIDFYLIIQHSNIENILNSILWWWWRRVRACSKYGILVLFHSVSYHKWKCRIPNAIFMDWFFIFPFYYLCSVFIIQIEWFIHPRNWLPN